ncbi:hypothetical protein NVP1090B_19 [Vibrio phage 1.090.B._10N.286.48.F1]|nr:hypothetical protein NVP1090B_19 [Vibrio phage 1.090.B._10N.286.48.F1]
MTKVSYSNVRFVSREGSFYDTTFKALVTKTTTKGFIFKKTVKDEVCIVKKATGFWFLEATGDWACNDIVNLVRSYNINCDKDKRLEY